MRDNYVGDIGDFANNGLLRALCGKPEKPVPGMDLGIIWYRRLDPDEFGNERDYLVQSPANDRRFRRCDPDLYRALQALEHRRTALNQLLTVPDLISLPIFPLRTEHFDEPVPELPDGEDRQNWFHRAVNKIRDCDVIFLNPDTGMRWAEEATPAHVHSRELRALLEMDKILIIYQHQQPHTDFVWDHTFQLRRPPLNVEHLRVCRWRRRRVRAYFMVARNKNQIDRIDERLRVLTRRTWVTERNFSVD